jgi:hypothetical protein
MKPALVFVLCTAPAASFADINSAAQDGEVLLELSQRSGIPESDLRDLLQDCGASQQSTYFCAYRDRVAADLLLRRTTLAKEQQLPTCKTVIESKLARWAKSRDAACAKSASKDWGEGSMKKTAETTCIASETRHMSARIVRIKDCST